MGFFSNANIWLDLLILILLEIILGIDNIVFIVLASNRLPASQQMLARRLGLILAMFMRLILLAFIFWLAHLSKVLFTLGSIGFSIRDIVEFAGGVFLIVKALHELYEFFTQKKPHPNKDSYAIFWLVIFQIVILDLVFSLDSVIIAVAIANYYWVMATAIVIAIFVMIVASEPVDYFIKKYVRIKLLALLLILMVGMMLVLYGLNIHFSEAYLYLAIGTLALFILPPWKCWFSAIKFKT